MLGEKLKKLREIRKITQKNLADVLGVGTSTVAMWETGGRHPDHEMLVRIADFFNVSVDSLLGRIDFSVRVDIESERIEYMSDIEKLRDKVLQSFNQALDEGLITEEQAKIGLTIIQNSMELIIESNKGKQGNQ